jgi:hypothetical protein
LCSRTRKKEKKRKKQKKFEKEKPDSRVDDGDDDDDAFVDATTMLLLPTDTINDVIAALSDALPLVTRVRLALADGVALDPSLQIGALTTRLSSASSSSITLSPFVPTRLFAKRAVYDIGSVIAHIDRFVTVVDVASFRTPEFDEQAPAISEFIVPRDVLAVPLAASIAAANEIPDSHYDVLGVVDKAVAASLTDFYPTILAGAPVDSCVRSVTLSSANPPSRARTAAGDLLYIDVALPDNEFVGITATRAGFIVNRSTATHVNVEPRAAAETWPHLWCALAGQVAKFRERLATVLLARSTSIAMLSSSSALPLSRFPAVFVAPPTRPQATGGLLASWRATSWLLRSVSESACREVLSTVFVTPSQGELQVMRGVEPRTYRDAQVCDKVLTQLHMQLGLLGLAGLRTLEAGGGLSSENSASVYNGTFVARVVPDFAIDELAAKTEDPDAAVRRSALEHAQRAAEKAAGNEIRVLRVLSSWQRPVPAMPDSAAADGATEGEALSAFEAQARGSAELDAPHTIAACVIDWCGHRYQAQPSISESLIINPDRALVYGCLHDTDKFAADDETALRAARTLARASLRQVGDAHHARRHRG